MFSIKMISFRKTKICPSSQEVLAFQNGETSADKKDDIREHLEICEFCAAEVEFYARYPQTDEVVAETAIPPQLYDLARALLSNTEKNVHLLNRFFDKDNFPLENA